VNNGEIKGVCDTRFSDLSANVACFELFGDPIFTRWSGGHNCSHREGYWLDNV